jgi:multidrug efflux system outer membrane protein
MIITIAALLSQSGCLMGPNYTRPETSPSDAWRLTPATAESIANVPWWELLRDQTLQDLIRGALGENLDLRVAVATIEQFQAQLVSTRFDLAPSVTLEGFGLYTHNTENTVAIPAGGGTISIPAQTTRSGGTNFATEFGGAGVSWELDLWGRIRRSVEAARAQLLGQVENQRTIVIRLVSNVAQAYFELRGLDLQIEITKRTLKAWDESVRVSRIRFEHGDIAKLDLNQFEAERASTAAQLADFEQLAFQKENQLSVLLGHRPMSIPRGVALTDQIVPPEVPAGLPSDLLQRRPDILMAEQDLAAATANIGVAQAQRFPSLSLTGRAGASALQLTGTQGLGPMGTFLSMANVTLPAFNATALGYQVKANEAKMRQALATYRRTILDAFQEVENALIAVQKAREKRSAQEQQVAALQSALGFAMQRYQGGRASYLDLLTAQRGLYSAELSLADTRRAQLTSMVQLYKALGGGWSPETRAGSTPEGISGPGGDVSEKPDVGTPVLP